MPNLFHRIPIVFDGAPEIQKKVSLLQNLGILRHSANIREKLGENIRKSGSFRGTYHSALFRCCPEASCERFVCPMWFARLEAPLKVPFGSCPFCKAASGALADGSHGLQRISRARVRIFSVACGKPGHSSVYLVFEQ